MSWTGYLAGLDAMAQALEASLAAAEALDGTDRGADLWMPAVPGLAAPLPAGPPPAGSQARREALLERLLLVTARLEQRRDDVAGRLAALPQRRPRTEQYAGTLGHGLDLVG